MQDEHSDLTAALLVLFAGHSADAMARAVAAAMPEAEKWKFIAALDTAYRTVPVSSMSVDWIEEELTEHWGDYTPKKRIKPGSEELIFAVLRNWDIDDKIFEAMHYVRDDIIEQLEKDGLIEPIPAEVTEGEQDG